MRFPFSQIYRAFPELDQYPDDQCERFVASARGRFVQRLGRFLTAGFLVVLGQIVVWIVFGFVASTLDRVQSAFGIIVFVVVIFLTALIGFLPGLLIRDRMLLGQIRRVLRERSSCLRCGYSLIGLPVKMQAAVICLSCGRSNTPKNGEVAQCSNCEGDLTSGLWQEEAIVICAECGSPGIVDPSLAELALPQRTGERATP